MDPIVRNINIFQNRHEILVSKHLSEEWICVKRNLWIQLWP